MSGNIEATTQKIDTFKVLYIKCLYDCRKLSGKMAQKNGIDNSDELKNNQMKVC